MRQESWVRRIAGPALACFAAVAIGGALPARSTDLAGPPVWFDPAWSDSSASPAGRIDRATVWFDRQLIGEGDAYAKRTATLANAKRRALRRTVVDSLRLLNDASWATAGPALRELEKQGVVTHCVRHWIVNGFTCDVPGGDPRRLGEVPGVARVFRAFSRPPRSPAGAAGSTPFVAEASALPDDYSPVAAHASWNAQYLGIALVWSELGLTGRGVLHVIHDFGWTFAPPPIRQTLWRNPNEKPGNGIDDDGNGLVDDVHGFDFDNENAVLASSAALLPGDVTHGDLTAAIATGRELADTSIVVGMAPGSRWAAVVSSLDIARSVEWAIEQGADTYSMSFSMPGLGELRAHWRKVMEHGALAGLFMISGAGNFATPGAANFVPVPVQMRTPEDIPLAVFGVSGVGRNGQRPAFSSQGPVLWQTAAYGEGTVEKPDLATVNTDIIATDARGNASARNASGWSGNSFAGPHLAGIIALMLEADPDLTPWRARDILIRTARDVEPAGFDRQTGAGIVDAYAAVRAVMPR